MTAPAAGRGPRLRGGDDGVPVLITLEGLDGSGKTTQFEQLVSFLRSNGYDFVASREPGGTPVGEALRQLLLKADTPLTIFSEAFLYAAARAELVARVVQPALAAGRSVLLDRYVDSSMAYQAYGRGLPPEFIASINQMGTGGIRPHRTILLDLPVSLALARKREAGGESGRWDRFEREEAEFFERVREGYLELAAEEPERFRVIDATRPAEEVQEAIRRLVLEIWPRREGSGARAPGEGGG